VSARFLNALLDVVQWPDRLTVRPLFLTAVQQLRDWRSQYMPPRPPVHDISPAIVDMNERKARVAYLVSRNTIRSRLQSPFPLNVY